MPISFRYRFILSDNIAPFSFVSFEFFCIISHFSLAGNIICFEFCQAALAFSKNLRFFGGIGKKKRPGEPHFKKRGFPRTPSSKIFELNGIGVGLSFGRYRINYRYAL